MEVCYKVFRIAYLGEFHGEVAQTVVQIKNNLINNMCRYEKYSIIYNDLLAFTYWT